MTTRASTNPAGRTGMDVCANGSGDELASSAPAPVTRRPRVTVNVTNALIRAAAIASIA